MLHDEQATPQALLQEASKWAERFGVGRVSTRQLVGPEEERRGETRPTDQQRRLRVGYLSPDFRRHTIAKLIAPILQDHDRTRFEVFCYSAAAQPDEMTDRLRKLADVWRDIAAMDDAQAERIIRADRIDILVDLAGHMNGNRLTLLARKPAAVQVQLGYAGTTGLQAIDYRITDVHCDPVDCAGTEPSGGSSYYCDENTLQPARRAGMPALADCGRQECSPHQTPTLTLPRGTGGGNGRNPPQVEVSAMEHRRAGSSAIAPLAGIQEFYTESLVRLPDCAWCYEPDEDAPDVGALPALSNGCVTFCCLNRAAKLSDGTLALWSQILRAVPSARLVLLGGQRDGENVFLRAKISAAGIDPARVRMLARLPRRQYLAALAACDIALDPFPYNGDTTTCDALWMGLPVVTLARERFAARRGVALLRAVGLHELIAATPQDYVAIAQALSANLRRLAALRDGLRQRLRESPLTDGKRYTSELEAVYGRIVGGSLSSFSGKSCG
jgi:predicted O-linked N-acetylglucosamine transferase (SPINDLY family)